jgi:glycosyltransferase involved in cell wall biosynthesis
MVAPEHRLAPLRVGIDLTALLPQRTGVDNYLVNLVSSLAQVDRESRYVLFTNCEDRHLFKACRAPDSVAPDGLPHNFRVLPLSLRPRPARLLFQQVVQPAVATTLRLDVLHSPSFISPVWRGSQRHVLTIHDMTSWTLPQCHIPLRRSMPYKRAVARSIRAADLVSVPSPSVRQDVLNLIDGVSPSRVRVIPLGIQRCFEPRPQDEACVRLRRLGIEWPYILFVGTIEPRKNIVRLVESYRELVTEGHPREHLVLAGIVGHGNGPLMEKLRAPELRGRVHLLGYVPEAELPWLYAGAALFAYPSLQEGFGFPPLEAMATGVPVVASLGSAMMDNLQGAAELVPPEDIGALTGAMRRLLQDEKLRACRVREGHARAEKFRWDRFARETLDCYRELRARQNPRVELRTKAISSSTRGSPRRESVSSDSSSLGPRADNSR